MKYQDGFYHHTFLSIIALVVNATRGTSWLNIYTNGVLFSAPMWIAVFLYQDIRWLNDLNSYLFWAVILGPEILIILALSMFSWTGLVFRETFWFGIVDVAFSALMYGVVIMYFSISALLNYDMKMVGLGFVLNAVYATFLYFFLRVAFPSG